MLNSCLCASDNVSADPAWKGIYRAGGVSFVIAAILFISSLATSLAGPSAFTATSGEALLTNLANQKLLFQITSGILTLGSIFLIPPVLALYLALKDMSRTRILIASGLALFGVVLFQGAVIVNYSLVRLSTGYAAAMSESERVAYAVAANLVIEATLAGITVGDIFFGVAVLIVSLVMLKGIFGKGTAYFGIVAGVVLLLGSIPLPALAVFFILSFVIIAVWFVVVGSRLYKLGGA